jgi:replication factor C subunit 3/5
MELLERVDDGIKGEILKWAGEYDHRLRMGSKAIFHLEAFCGSIILSNQM